MPRPKGPPRIRPKIGLSAEDESRVEDIKKWDGLKSIASVLRRALDEYWKRRAWERSQGKDE